MVDDTDPAVVMLISGIIFSCVFSNFFGFESLKIGLIKDRQHLKKKLIVSKKKCLLNPKVKSYKKGNKGG